MSAGDFDPHCIPIGHSYAIGQAILHQEVPRSETRPELPSDDFLLAFADAVDGATRDRSTWTPAQIDQEMAHARTRQDVFDAFAAVNANGPLPTDSEGPGSGKDNARGWGAADQISKQRYVYFFDSQGNYGNTRAHGLVTGLDATTAKYVQIQGYSESTQSWVLPRLWGSQVIAWRYEAPNNWRAVASAGAWVADHGTVIAQAFMIVWGAILTVMTAGAAAAAVVAGELALAAAISAASALALGAVKAAFSGDSSALMAALVQAGGAAVQLSTPELAKLSTQFPGVANVITKLGATVSDLESRVGKLGEHVDLTVWLSAAKTIAPTAPGISWDQVSSVVGPGPGAFFLSQCRAAASIDVLTAIHDACPWYARGFAEIGATVRAMELGRQEASDARTLASSSRRTGLVSVRYALSLQGRLESPQSAPLLSRVTAHHAPARNLPRAPPSRAVAAVAIVAVPALAFGLWRLVQLVLDVADVRRAR